MDGRVNDPVEREKLMIQEGDVMSFRGKEEWDLAPKYRTWP